MAINSQEIIDELKSVISGKTFDAVLPPLIFVFTNNLFNLNIAAIIALSLATVLAIRRFIKGENWFYALGGLLGTGLAAGLALISRTATGYFIPGIITSILILIIALISLILKKPLAAWASHLTRGWPLEWFWRDDIKPAYQEVTIFWAVLFAVRLTVQLILFRAGDATRLAWANTILGWPVTISVLILSYIYGIWRLKKLGGPGVDEFREGKEPPWEGQKKGF